MLHGGRQHGATKRAKFLSKTFGVRCCEIISYSLIVRTTLEVVRLSLAGPFTCLKIASS